MFVGVIALYMVILFVEIMKNYKKYILKEKVISFTFIIIQLITSLLIVQNYRIYTPIDIMRRIFSTMLNR